MFEESLLCEIKKETVIQQQNGLNRANFLNKFTFSWLNPLLSLGYKNPLVLLVVFGVFFNVPYANRIKNCKSQVLKSQDQRLQ